jgi:uncharacterized lipoprotein YbaY
MMRISTMVLRFFTQAQCVRSILVLTIAMVSHGDGQRLFGQFSGGGGLFDSTLNSALPRVATPMNQNPTGGWNQTNSAQTGFSSNGFNTGTMTSVPNMNSSQFATGANTTSQIPRDWRLGVSVDPSDVGAVVRQVTPSGAAQRVGLEPNDIIVSINGFQVGMVENRLNDVGEQIRRSADSNGRVRALVFQSRSARLQNVTIQLDSGSNGITGSVALSDRGSIPFNSIVTVQIENVTRPFYEVRNGKVTFAASGNGPFPFDIQYDPAYVDARDRYQLNATITDSTGRPLYGLRQPIAIPTGGLPQNTLLALDNARMLQSLGQQPVGGAVTSGFGQDPAVLNQVFQQILGRLPSSTEQVAWSQFLAQGNSVIDLQAKIIGSPAYFDRLGNNPQRFIQSMIRTFSGREATANELNAWLGRLQQYQGNREQVAREFLQQMR